MKEATGELNMTVVTVVAVAALMAFFYAIIWPTIKTGLALQSACSSAGTGTYNVTDADGNLISCTGGDPNHCTYTDIKSGATNEKTC